MLGETGLTWARDGIGIDCTVTCCEDHLEGQLISNLFHELVAGGYFRPGVKCAKDGANAAVIGFVQILSGHYDVVLVTACCKESMINQSEVENFGFETIFHRKLGLDFLQAAALQATR